MVNFETARRQEGSRGIQTKDTNSKQHAPLPLSPSELLLVVQHTRARKLAFAVACFMTVECYAAFFRLFSKSFMNSDLSGILLIVLAPVAGSVTI